MKFVIWVIVFIILSIPRLSFAEERIKTVKTRNTVQIDYFYGKTLISRYEHFLPNHHRHKRYIGKATLFAERPRTTIWIGKKREVAIVFIGGKRYDRRSILGRIVCDYAEREIVSWRKRLEIDGRVREALE